MAYLNYFRQGAVTVANANVASHMVVAGHVHGLTGGAMAIASHTLYAVPYFSARGGFVQQMAIRVTTARANSFARLCIYGIASLNGFYPDGMLLVSSVPTTVNNTFTSISIAASLASGTLYWLGIVSNANISVNEVDADRAYPIFGYEPTSCFPRAMLVASIDASSVPPIFPMSATAVGSDMPAIAFGYASTMY